MNDLLVELQRQNIDVSVDGDKLKLDIPHGQNVDALLKKVQSNKDELLAFVKNRAAKSIPIAPDREYYDLSSAQKRLYFLHEFNSETLAYNVPIAIRIKGELDLDKLTEAIRSLVDRHEILRTRFDMFNGLPKQIISESIEIPIEIVNIDEAQVEEMVESFYQSFDLKNGPLIRVKIGEVSSVEHVMLVDMHHIIADATSLEVFKRDLMHFYSNEPLPELIVQYKDVVEWQQSDVQQELLENQKDFWIKEFQTIPVSNLPLDFPRPAVKSFEGANLNFQITGQKFELLKKIARDNGLTVFMFTLAIYKIFLSKICNNEDVTIGTPVAGRNHKDLKDSIGMFINSLVIRSFPKAEITIADYLQELKEKFFTCLENQNYQYDDLVDELKIERSASKNPLYDARFVFQNFEKTENELADLTMEVIDKQKQEAQFDLSLIVREEKDLLFCDFNYSTELFEKTTIKKFIQYFNATLDGVLENSSTRIGDIDILLKEEKDLLNTFNSTSVDYPAGRTILDYFVSQVAQTPDRAAVVSGGSSLSYAALEE
ncbi:MAG: condensation domain-containing protein, partial [Fulvivirga sp.]